MSERGQEKAISQTEIRHIENEYAGEIEAAKAIVESLQAHFDIVVPVQENYFVAILLANSDPGLQQGHPALLIVAQGESTASSMADVCNRLMGCDFVWAVNAPLDQSVKDTYKTVLQQVHRCDPEKGAVLLVDMGSLIGFGEKITEETGIPTRTIPNVTTLMALDLAHKLLGKEDDIDRLCMDSLESFTKPAPTKKRQAIITVCASGAGTSEAFKTMIEAELEKNELPVHVVTLRHSDVQENTQRYRQVREKYDAIACVGNIYCDIDMPFFHVSKLISESDKQSFIKFVSGVPLSTHQTETEAPSDAHKECRHFLAKNVTFLNPEVAVRFASRFLDALDLSKVNSSANLQYSLILHLGFMLERNICGNKVVFDNEAVYRDENRDLMTFCAVTCTFWKTPSRFPSMIQNCAILFELSRTAKQNSYKLVFWVIVHPAIVTKKTIFI